MLASRLRERREKIRVVVGRFDISSGRGGTDSLEKRKP
jgi:hypothetical protein